VRLEIDLSGVIRDARAWHGAIWAANTTISNRCAIASVEWHYRLRGANRWDELGGSLIKVGVEKCGALSPADRPV